jgi:ribosome-associated translation inhibitor RaiA
MKYTENYENVKLDVQTVDITIDDDVKQRLRNLITHLVSRNPKITHANIYLEDKSHKSTNPKSVSIRLGVPGKDPFASDSGDNFMVLLASVEEKLRKQLEKR